MSSILDQVVAGTFTSNVADDAETTTVMFYNYLYLPLSIYHLNGPGKRKFVCHADPVTNPDGSATTSELGEYAIGDAFLVTARYSGAIIFASRLSENYPDQIDAVVTEITVPNKVGQIPLSTADVPVPANTPSVLVALGKIKGEFGPFPSYLPAPDNKTEYLILQREQHWRLQGESTSLAPGESREVNYTVTTGMEQSSSAQADVAASLGLSANIGWGPIGASFNASLNADMSVSQQTTLSEQTSVYVAERMRNKGEKSMIVNRWQLVDTINVYPYFNFTEDSAENMAHPPLITISSGLSPIVTISETT